MKKLSFLTIILLATCTVAMAQPRAIGGRLGWGAGVSYQHGFSEKSMLQVDLDSYCFYYGLQATVTFNGIHSFSSWNGPGSWNWYSGVGGGLGLFWGNIIDPKRDYWTGGGIGGVAFMMGVEYNFKFPLQISLDYRPLIGAYFGVGAPEFHILGLFGGGLGIRYKF